MDGGCPYRRTIPRNGGLRNFLELLYVSGRYLGR
jgi:hypothetical protein